MMDKRIRSGTRVFEEVYYKFLGRVRPYAPIASSAVLGAASLKMSTPLYVVETVILTLILKFSGPRLKRTLDYLKITVVIVSLACLMEVLASKPPLTMFIVSSNLASSLSYALGQSTLRWILPNLASAGYYLVNNNLEFAAFSFLYIPAIPVLVLGLNRITGINAVNMIKGFTLWETIGTSFFEEELERLSPEERELKAHVFLFRGKKEGNTFSLIVTDAHPGPFGKVGGSVLIDELLKNSINRGIGLLFLHGVGGHENDIVRASDASRFAEVIMEEIDKMRRDEDRRETYIHRPYVYSTNNLSILTLYFNGKRVAIVSSKERSSDDLPYRLSRLEEKFNAVIVDAQNSYMLDNGDEDEIEKEIEDYLRSVDNFHASCATAKVGYAQISAEDLDLSRKEIGSLGIRTMVIECDGKRTALVSFDGNNMNPRLRSRMTEELKKLVDDVEIVTTDNHSIVGLRGKRGYNTIGESSDWGELIKRARESVMMSLRNLDEANISYSVVRFKTRVLGERNFERLREAVMRVPICVFIYLMVLVFIPFMISYLY